MDISSYFSVWGKLAPATQQALSAAVMSRRAEVGTVLYRGEAECLGLVVLKSGRLRTYMISPDGREVTLYRLLEGDICLFSASCVLNGLQLDIIIEAERESELLVIPSYIFKQQMEKSLPLAHYVNEIMNSRLSEVMWLMEQIMWKSMDARLADFLLAEAVLEESTALKITHERIAAHLGSAREVVTRLLRYFQQEGLVELSRGQILLTDEKKLRELAG